MPIILTDDGTLDTVLTCTDCGQEFRGNYDPAETSHDGPDLTYDAYVEMFMDDTERMHVCQDDE